MNIQLRTQQVTIMTDFRRNAHSEISDMDIMAIPVTFWLELGPFSEDETHTWHKCHINSIGEATTTTSTTVLLN